MFDSKKARRVRKHRYERTSYEEINVLRIAMGIGPIPGTSLGEPSDQIAELIESVCSSAQQQRRVSR